MPPPSIVICEICNGKFSKHSIAIHQKACVVKRELSTEFWCVRAAGRSEQEEEQEEERGGGGGGAGAAAAAAAAAAVAAAASIATAAHTQPSPRPSPHTARSATASSTMPSTACTWPSASA